MDNSSKTIANLIERGVVDCTIKENLKKRLLAGDCLRVKLGIDPTGSDLHLGHSVILRKLRDFQQAGHEVILLIGTFTGKIGDPTGKDKMRTPLTDQQIEENMKDFLHQASKVIDIKKIKIVKNGDWLAKLTFKEVVTLAATFTVNQMIQRESFQKRIKEKKEISLHEFLYPLMQGYDSVPLKADLELGGTDQLFNLLAGRQIQKKFDLPPQDIMTMPILVGTDGKEKMSKSLGNYIALNDQANEVFGKTMSIPDDLMENWFELLTDLPLKKIKSIIKGHPRDAKLLLAQEITTNLHGQEKALKAKEEFLNIFAKKELPSNIKEFIFPKGSWSILEIIAKCKLCSSNSEIKQMLLQKAVKVNEQKITDKNTQINISSQPQIIQVGKRKFAKILSN